MRVYQKFNIASISDTHTNIKFQIKKFRFFNILIAYKINTILIIKRL